jgi:glycerophosphoryl diester phosphodiesterase
VTSPVAIVHRLPEDPAVIATLAAAGAGGFELDVQLRGRTVVVSHYLPFLQLPGWLEHDGSRFRWRGGPPKDRTLAQALAQLPPRAVVTLDPKEQLAGRRSALIAALTTYPALPRDRIVVTTSDERDLARYRAAGLRTWRTIHSDGDLARVLRADPVDEGVAVRHDLLDAGPVRRLCEVFGGVAAWVVNDVARAQQLLAWGVTAITTDDRAVISVVAGG